MQIIYKHFVSLLYFTARDQKITQVDSIVQFKKYDKEIKSLKKEILDNRFNLDNAIYGDKQIIKNILAEYEEFRLAFQDLEPTVHFHFPFFKFNLKN